jgi:hypothetical protein
MNPVEHTQQMMEQAAEHSAVHSPAINQPGPMPLTTLPVANQGSDYGTFKTVVLSAANPYKLGLPEDNTRRHARIIAIDNPVILCHSENMAQDGANEVTDTPAPNGGYIPVGLVVPVTCQSVVFLAATTTATESRVFVSIERDADS